MYSVCYKGKQCHAYEALLRGSVLPLSIPWLVHGMTPNAFCGPRNNTFLRKQEACFLYGYFIN
ncbi:MAG TPA: hypothetical protein LFV92_04050 [Rickettsia endosymbiont of Ceroptres masudai]|nr:hypothetical protein [Rickettsia endosymbiont of Ceroptres masudai]